MPEEVSVNKELGIIEVWSHGVVTREDLSRTLQQTDALVKETGFNKVLVDTTEEEQLPAILDLDNFGASIPSSLRIAVLLAEAQPTAKKAEFVKNVASVKGVCMETFTSRGDSLEWLNQ
ncbi:MAG: hypothetical protein HQ582_21855 [Planctomycetes bacterium]|nr:hypothetical protein [Planctomycetota bacterium]